jgi:hypothetical protein
MLGLYPWHTCAGGLQVGVSSEMSVVTARELPTPKVTYFKGSLQVKMGAGIYGLLNFTAVSRHQIGKS